MVGLVQLSQPTDVFGRGQVGCCGRWLSDGWLGGVRVKWALLYSDAAHACSPQPDAVLAELAELAVLCVDGGWAVRCCVFCASKPSSSSHILLIAAAGRSFCGGGAIAAALRWLCVGGHNAAVCGCVWLCVGVSLQAIKLVRDARTAERRRLLQRPELVPQRLVRVGPARGAEALGEKVQERNLRGEKRGARVCRISSLFEFVCC